jgi:hypothetical protein
MTRPGGRISQAPYMLKMSINNMYGRLGCR